MSETSKQLGRMFLLVLFLAAPAFGQFEVAPDHFPNADEPVARQASPHSAQREQRFAKQQAMLAKYRAEIQAKTEQVVAAAQALQLASGGTRGVDAPVRQQRELQELLGSLAASVRGEQATLARLQREQAMTAHLRARYPTKHKLWTARVRSGT